MVQNQPGSAGEGRGSDPNPLRHISHAFLSVPLKLLYIHTHTEKKKKNVSKIYVGKKNRRRKQERKYGEDFLSFLSRAELQWRVVHPRGKTIFEEQRHQSPFTYSYSFFNQRIPAGHRNSLLTVFSPHWIKWVITRHTEGFVYLNAHTWVWSSTCSQRNLLHMS